MKILVVKDEDSFLVERYCAASSSFVSSSSATRWMTGFLLRKVLPPV